ncbi:MAG: mismatch repair protein MutL [Pyrinomonadaceae bacterium]|jgi:DNA mismatch repair protein MutL|nr:mismatch repair protein MutL [Pyrinomonadaceae bacterium]
MSKIRVLSDHLANQIAAGEVVERPASVAKELVENAIDAGARRIEVDVEAGGRRLLRVTDDGEGMSQDDALLAFERHATSKISTADDLSSISTLGFRGEALASIASVARVELVTQTEGGAEGTRVLIEGGRMRDVKPAARPRGTTITVRDLFFNVPARRKFLRSEATESFHLTSLVTHYALAHPEIAFVLTNNGRESLRAAPAANLRERAYQIFGAEFLDNLLEIGGGHEQIARVSGYVSAPRERRTTRDAQYLFVNGRYVRDRLVSRALGEGYRTVLPHGVYPAALLFLEVPLEEVDVNVHPAKTEVRFRRAAAVTDAVREAVRAALAAGGYVRLTDDAAAREIHAQGADARNDLSTEHGRVASGWDALGVGSGDDAVAERGSTQFGAGYETAGGERSGGEARRRAQAESLPQQESIEFGFTPPSDDELLLASEEFAARAVATPPTPSPERAATDALARNAGVTSREGRENVAGSNGLNATHAGDELTAQHGARVESPELTNATGANSSNGNLSPASQTARGASLPPLNSIAGAMYGVEVENVSTNIRPLYQLEESYIIAIDAEGMLLIDQHAAHERILFDKYRKLEQTRAAESQALLLPETFDLTPAQAAAFDTVAEELETYGFSLMRLSGRTVAIKAVPADLPANEARNMLAEVLETVDAERRGAARESLRERVAASLACHAAIKVNMPLAPEKMRWLIDRLLHTSSPTTCPHGRPAILRLTTRDIERGFHRP